MPRLTKRVVDLSQPTGDRYIVWDDDLKGFGLRVEASGTKTYILRYRPKGSGSSGPKRFQTIGRHGALTPDQARTAAKQVLGEVANGADPAMDRQTLRDAISVAELGRKFMHDHVTVKRRPNTQALYKIVIEKHIEPIIGKRKSIDIRRSDVARLHLSMRSTPVMANRMLAVLASMYSWGENVGVIPTKMNPTEGIERYKEVGKERFLSDDELERLGVALNKSDLDIFVKAAIRLLLLTGCRLREILHMKWEDVDFERRLFFLREAKAGKRTVIISDVANEVLSSLPRIGPYVISGSSGTKPRADLKRPWKALQSLAGLEGVRLHDLRHTNASVGAGMGLSLPVIGKLLGHTQARTTTKYAHLSDDPVRRGANLIGGRISAALSGRGSD